MTSTITFPSASNTSKLSASPAAKVPEGTDWIYQDYFYSMLNNSANEYQKKQISTDFYPTTTFNEALTQIAVSDSSYNNYWDSHIDYRFCPTSMTTSPTFDQMSLPDLDNTKSSDEEDNYYYEEEEEDDDHSMVMVTNHTTGGNGGVASDFSLFMNVAPVLIESSITSCTTSSEDAMSFRYNNNTTTETTHSNNRIIQGLNKRKSTSSFQSLKSFINVFSNKKSKLNHSKTASSLTTTATLSKKDALTGTLTKKFLNYFSSRRS